MSEIRLNIEDKYVRAFLDFLKTLNYVSVREVILPERQLPHNGTAQAEPSASDRILSDDPLHKIVKPLRKGIKAEDLINEQGYKGTDWKRLQQLAEDMDIKEPMEVLLAQLTP